ncbi:sensor domain-containing diguanylate cyclase [Paenibacillus daejeonensis]|uniref:sensor domain-containing diguanylate cyclase n=1 Tax=Paenibacillus daejeonensis TaxID=135193 RepID=UPI000367112D|nr:diguanylate cyclase [Paenibacillus daejeonensis]
MINEIRPADTIVQFGSRHGRMEELEQWLSGHHISAADVPYLAPLLIDSFNQWILETNTLPAHRGALIVLMDHEGRRLAASGELEQGLAEENEAVLALLLAAVADALPRQLLTDGVFHPTDDNHTCQITVVSIYDKSGNERLGMLGYVSKRGSQAPSPETLQATALHYRACFYHRCDRFFMEDLFLYQEKIRKEMSSREALFSAAKRLHDQIDVTSVLHEIIQTVETLYAQYHVDLFLSQDYVHVDTRVKPLLFRHGSDDLCARAFMEGQPVTEARGEGFCVAVPIRGKQAVYGVLLLATEQGYSDIAELPALTMLADTAGTAFENAKLYEQSNLLINELQLINELTKRLNQSLRPKEIFQFATTELIDIFHADYCCLLQKDKETEQFVVMSCNYPVLANEKFPSDYGFTSVVYETKEPLIISDYHATHPVASRLMELTGSRSLIAAPIVVGTEVVGVILVSHSSSNYFSYDNYKLLQVLSTHIGLAITNASLHAEVRHMVITDNLTGLRVRHYLNEQIQQRQRKDPYGSLILVDIDHFKRINDTYGHQVGDKILKQVSDIIRSCIRDSDIAARWGGEELAVYLPKVNTAQACRIAERILEQVAAETHPKVTISCGVSEWTFEDEKISVESLFYRADMAMYEAKHNGRNCISVG